MLQDIEFAQPVEPRPLIGNRFEFVAMRLVHLADRVQPVIDQAAPLTVDCRADTAAAVVTDHDDVLHLDDVDCELQDGEVVGVLRRRQIGDVAVNEQLARIEVDDLVGRNAAVGAADPEILGRLLALQPLEEARVGGDLAFCPGAVFRLQVIEHSFIRSFTSLTPSHGHMSLDRQPTAVQVPSGLRQAVPRATSGRPLM